jgi:hypothetical protein
MMKKSIFLITIFYALNQCSARVVHICRDSDSPLFSVVSQTSNSITLTVTLDKFYENSLYENGTEYKSVTVKGFGSLNKKGEPALPYRSFSVLTSENPDIQLSIIEHKTVTLKNYCVCPSPGPVHPYQKAGNNVTINNNIYSANRLYPSNIIKIINTVDYRGLPVVKIGITPIQTNPVLKELKISRRLTFKITFLPPSPSSLNRLRSENVALLKNAVVNKGVFDNITGTSLEDFEDDVLVLTHNDYIAAAETLAVWQRMKGYDVHIESKPSWDSVTIKNVAHNFYNNATVKPGYLLIIGEMVKMPSPIGNYVNFKPYPMDVYYASMDGPGDFVPEMARGRISVKSPSEAMTVAQKIIRYEKNPSTSPDYFKNILASAFFQTAGNEGYEELGFTRTVENVTVFLDSIGYSMNRAYTARPDKNPTYWNNGTFGFGEEIPSYLKKPAFAWDADENTIASVINNGCFLAYHYDHGLEDGWVDPNFKIENMKSLLSNSNTLPVIYSMDCLVGRYNEPEPCFAEEILKKENGGAVGIIAAACVSYTGNNEAFLHGLIDATWPGTILRVPQFSDPLVTSHEPVYIIGDIMDQGLFRMSELWPDSAINDAGFMWTGMTKFHYDIYHYFGDPTTRIWTAEPENITVNHTNAIAQNAGTYSLSNMNITDGVATLYDTRTGVIVGKIKISGSSASITIVNPISSGGTVILTITGQNLRPYIKELPIGQSSIGNMNTSFNSPEIQLKNSKIIFGSPNSRDVRIAIYNVKGKLVYRISGYNSDNNCFVIDCSNLGISHGTYLIQYNAGNKIIRSKFCFIK